MTNLEILNTTNLITSMILDNESIFIDWNIKIYSNGNKLFIENYPLYLTRLERLINTINLTKHTFEIQDNIIKIF
jgi:hypothetical protein